MLEGKGSDLEKFCDCQPSFMDGKKGGKGGGGYNSQNWCECRYQIAEKCHDMLFGKRVLIFLREAKKFFL